MPTSYPADPLNAAFPVDLSVLVDGDDFIAANLNAAAIQLGDNQQAIYEAAVGQGAALGANTRLLIRACPAGGGRIARLYYSTSGYEIAINALWNQGSTNWTPDATSPAILYSFGNDTFQIFRKAGATAATPFTTWDVPSTNPRTAISGAPFFLSTAEYHVSDGKVFFEGGFTNTSGSPKDLSFTMPAGLRPAGSRYLTMTAAGSTLTGYIIDTAGLFTGPTGIGSGFGYSFVHAWYRIHQ